MKFSPKKKNDLIGDEELYEDMPEEVIKFVKKEMKI